ncbi:MAG: pantetheine-phosphate adenylyltransferase [candidate division Zixibacteria bacterium]|nr:pantetheine-phosphate adenylyltransferase [candidate division Zixibacteria bacterium]
MTQSRKRINRAVYPGTFDPVTNGHLSLINRASSIFDELIVAVSKNSPKDALFSFEERFELMEKTVEKIGNRTRIRVIPLVGLTAELVKELKVNAIVRGLRAVSDFEYEFQMALMNRKLAREVETVYFMPALSWVYLSSSIVKEVALNGGDVKGLVPPAVRKALIEKYKQRNTL